MALPTAILAGDELLEVSRVDTATVDVYGHTMQEIVVLYKGDPVLVLNIGNNATDDKIMHILEEALDLGSHHL